MIATKSCATLLFLLLQFLKVGEKKFYAELVEANRYITHF